MIRDDNSMRKITGIFWGSTEYELMKDERGFFVRTVDAPEEGINGSHFTEETTRLNGVRMSKNVAFQYIDFVNRAVVASGGNTFGYFSGFNKHEFPFQEAWNGSLIAKNYRG